MSQENDTHRDLVTQIKEIDQYYQSLSIEVDNRALNLTAVDCFNSSSAISPSSTDCPDAVNKAWGWLERALKCVQTHLANAANYHKFFHEVRHQGNNVQGIFTRLKQLDVATQYRSNQHEGCIGKIIEEIKEILRLLLESQARVDALYSQSPSIVPVHLRKLPVKNPLPVVALTSYVHDKIKIDENSTYSLVDNTDQEKWKVKTSEGAGVSLPSLIFVIPPPDNDALQAAHRLRQQLLSTWKSCVGVLKHHARTVLSQYLNGHDKRELVNLNNEQRTQVVDCLANALALLTDDSAGANDVLGFQKMIDSWKESISVLKPNSSNKRNVTAQLQNDWVANKKLLRQILEFEAYIKSYDETVAAATETKKMLINGDLASLKYVSVAYIEKWPKKDERSLADGGSSGSRHLIMAEKGPVHTSRYISQLEAELEEFMSETVTEDQEVAEVTSQTIQETKRFMIRGVVDPRTNHEISIYQAIADKIINPNQGLYRNPATGESMPIPEAMDRGLILVEYINRSVEMGELIKSGIIKTITTKEMVSYHVLSIRDPLTGMKISVSEALRRGIIDSEQGRYIINPKTGDSISIPTAIDKGFLEVEVIERRDVQNDVVDGMVDGMVDGRVDGHLEKDLLVESVYDPVSRRNLTLDEAVARGIVNLERGVYVRPDTNEKLSVEDAIQRGYLSVRLAPPGSKDIDSSRLLGRRLMAVNSEGVGDFEKMVTRKADVFAAPLQVSITEKLRNRKELEKKYVTDPVSGKKLTVTEALRSGLLTLDPLSFVLPDGSKCTVFEAAQKGLIDASTLSEIAMLLEPYSLQRYISEGTIDANRGQYVDPVTGERMSLAEAISRGKLDPEGVFFVDNLGRSVLSLSTAIKNKKFDAESGCFIDPLTGKKLTIAEAILRGLISADVNAEEMSSRLSSAKVLGALFESKVGGIKDPRTGEEISLEDAVLDGILDVEKAEFVHPGTKQRMPLSEAVARGLLSPETAKKVLEAMSHSSLEDLITQKRIDLATGRFIDPETKRRITIKEAIEKGLLDPGSVFLVNPSDNLPVSLSTLIRDGKFNPETGKFRDASTGLEVSIATAVKQGTIATRFEADDLLDGKRALKDLLEGRKVSQNSAMFVLPNGDVIPLKEAMANGFLSSEAAVKVDRETGNVVLADGSEAVVQALIDTKSHLDFVNGVESQIAQQEPVTDDAGQLRQLTAVNENLKRTLDGQRRAIGSALTNAQRLIDTEEGSPQQIQRLKCNTTDLRIRFDEVNRQSSNRIDQLKSLTKDAMQFSDDCRHLEGWTEKKNRELEECKRKLKTADDFEPVKKQIEGFTDELQRQDGRLQSTKAIGQKVTDAVKTFHKESRKYVDGLENPNTTSSADDSLTGEEVEKNVETRLNSVGEKFHQIGDDFQGLSDRLVQIASTEVQYQQAKSKLEGSLPELEGSAASCSVSGTDAKGLQQAMERVKAVTVGVLDAGKQVKEMRDMGEGVIQVLDQMELGECPKAKRIQKDIDAIQAKYDHIQEVMVERQQELSQAVVQSQDSHQNLIALLQWVGESEAYLNQLKPVSLDRAKLTRQIQEHRMFTSEIENRRPRVSAVVDQCRAQGSSERVDELLDRFDSLRSKNEVRGHELEDVIRKLTDLHASVDQMESWLTSAVHSLKRSGSSLDQSSLKAKIESLYVQKQGKQDDLEKIKTIGRELIEDPVTGDKHHLRETIADMQGKWQDLTELLVQMISYSALTEIDELLKYLDRAENEMNTADVISIDPEALAVQLRDHKAFHEDLKNKRKAVNSTIDKCNQMLLETTNEEADDIKHKLNIIRDQADLVFRLSSERCSTLEEALPLVSHFCDTRTDLQSWLNEMEAEVNSMEVNVDGGGADQIKKQLENAKSTLRIIDDHRTLMQDLLATGQDLIDICGEEDGQDIRADLQETMYKYSDIKAIARQKMNILKDKLRASTQELNEGVENLAEELYYVSDQIQHVDPISIKPNIVREQTAECQAILDDYSQCVAALDTIKTTVAELLQQEPNENVDEYKEIDGKLQELDALRHNVREKYDERSTKLDDALGVAERFQQDYVTVMQNLQGVKDNLLSQDVSGIDPATVQEQQKELQAIKDDLHSSEPLLNTCRKTADRLGSISGGPGAVELQKLLEDMDRLVEDIQEGITDRDLELNLALEKSENCTNYLDTVMAWLPKSEDTLRRMAPPASDSRAVQAQLEELKRFKAVTQDRHPDILHLNHYTAALKNSSPITAESLVTEVKEINERWSNLLMEISDRERALNVKLVDGRDVDLVIDGVMESLLSAQTELAEMDIVKGDGKVLENALRSLQILQNSLTSQEPLIQRLNDAAQRIAETDSGKGAPLVDRCQELNDLYAVVQVVARDKQNRLQDRLKEFKGFMGQVEELMRWMKEYRAALVSCPPMSALPDTAEHQLDDFMEGYQELEKKEGDVKSVLLTSDDLWGQCPEKDSEAVKEATSSLQDRTYGTRTKAEKRKGKMEGHLRTVQEFHGMLRIHTDWLNNAEKVLGTFKHPSKLVDKVIQQISEHKSFRQSLDQHTEMMSQIEHMGAFLKFFGGRQDNIYIQTLLMTIKVRWKKLVRRVDDKGRLLNHAYQEDKRFYDEWKSICDWLDMNEQRLRKFSANLPAKVKQDIDDLQHFQQQLSAKQSSYHSASRLGRNLKDRCTKADPEREVLHGMLEELKTKWNALRSVMTQRQSKLDEALLSSGRFSDAINSLTEWLGKAEGYLTEDQPVLGDLDTVTILTEHHKAFQQELASRQAMVEAIRSSVGDDPAVNTQLNELNDLWDHVNQLSDARDYRLQDALKLAEEFQDVVQVVREWLPLAEAELKFRAMPEDEDSLVQLLENHERFQEDLRAQQPNVEKIVTMADEILQACHPSAVRFVRYYLTITHTRWEQAVNRSNQRMQRLQEALRNMRGNAALLEDLLTWLTEAHALLTAKEKDPIPGDLTVVEVLVKEHLEFHEDLCMKNKDVERLTKAPPSNSRLQLHGSAWKLNEMDALSPRVMTLQNKWRTVWRISVDRKKRLQDMLDQLLELESFKNFDFDHWRQRYVAWIRSKKLRITDFFRRQDKNGFGTLTRDQFVSGMLISKFPTNRTELNAVFDIFDRNRSGEIEYSEFIDALRPERQHGGRRTAARGQTDADLIHDEIEQQSSRCQCRHQFDVERVGEGKYKFGEKGKLCLVRYLNSTVMVRVGGGWVTLASFLDNNDPCRARGRLNTDLRDTLSSDSTPQLYRSTPRRSIPNIPDVTPEGQTAPAAHALDSRLSGSTSSLSSVGKSSTKGKAGDSGSNLGSKRSTNMAKSCINLASGSSGKGRTTPEPTRPPSAPKRPTTSTPHSTSRPPSKSAVNSTRLNGSATGRLTPTPSGMRTPTASKTPTGSRTGSPTPSRKQSTASDRRLPSVKQNMRF